MVEMSRDPDSSHDFLPPEGASLAIAPLASSPPQHPSGAAGLFRAILTIPLAFIRNPWRSLMIVALLSLIVTGTGIAGLWLWASYHLRAGRSAMEHYHTTEALPHLQAVLSLWPHDPETLLLASRAARRAGIFDEADRLLDRYQELRPDDEKLTLERVFVRAERGETDSVAKFCRSLIERNSSDAPLIFEALSKGYLRNYQIQKAKSVLQKWLEQESDNPQAYLIQGQLHDLELRHSEAIRSYRLALTADPMLNEARLRMCDDLMQLGWFEEARPHLEYLAGCLPDNPQVQVYLARLEDRLGHGDEAERILDAVLAHRPRFVPALVERGILARRAHHPIEAEKWLRLAVEEDMSNHQAHHQLALCLEQNGKQDEAEKEQEHLKQIERDTKEIQAIANGQLERTPHDANLHYRIGMIAMRAGAFEEALRWLHGSLKEDSNHQLAHKALMEYYQRIGDFGRAREHRQHLTTRTKS